jgi:DNA-binding CsgD family transcriptional regulator
MSIDPKVLSVVEALYDAAIDETAWPAALSALADLTDSQAATFWVLDGTNRGSHPLFTYINFDPAFIQEYLNGVLPTDPNVQFLMANPQHAIVHDGMVIAERDKDRHAYYDWHGRYSDTRFRLIGRVCPAPDVHAGVALHRTRKVGRYGAGDIDQFAFLYRHLQRALMIGVRLGSLGAVEQCTTAMLDRNSTAMILLDKQHRVIFTNKAAAALRVQGDGISLTNDVVVLLHREENARLQALIGEAAIRSATAGATRAGVMRATRPSGKRSYGIVVVAITERYPLLSTMRPAVCLLVQDPAGDASLPSDALQAMFGLTRAEAQLAGRLATGEDLRAAAEHLGITYGTARVRLAEILQKTDTRRQGELVSLVLSTFPHE